MKKVFERDLTTFCDASMIVLVVEIIVIFTLFGSL